MRFLADNHVAFKCSTSAILRRIRPALYDCCSYVLRARGLLCLISGASYRVSVQ